MVIGSRAPSVPVGALPSRSSRMFASVCPYFTVSIRIVTVRFTTACPGPGPVTRRASAERDLCLIADRGFGLERSTHLGNITVVKSHGTLLDGSQPLAQPLPVPPAPASNAEQAVAVPADARTRDRVAKTMLEHGPINAATLADLLGLTPAAVRRHLDAMTAEGRVIEVAERPVRGKVRGRGRPAKLFALSEAGRNAFPHGYDELAISALRFLDETGGEAAVKAFAERRLAGVEERYLGAARSDERPRRQRGSTRGAVRGAVRRRLRRVHPRSPAPASSSASTTARWLTLPRSSPRSATPRRRPSAGCSAPMSSVWPPSPTATVSAPRTFRCTAPPPPPPP